MCFSLNSEGGLLGRAAEQSSTRSLVPWLFLRDHNISQRAPRATCARPYRNSYRAALLRDSAGWPGESLPAPPAKCQVGQDRQHYHRNPGQVSGLPVSLERASRAVVHVLARSVTRTRRAHVTCLRYVECNTNLVQWCTHFEHRVEKNANWNTSVQLGRSSPRFFHHSTRRGLCAKVSCAHPFDAHEFDAHDQVVIHSRVHISRVAPHASSRDPGMPRDLATLPAIRRILSRINSMPPERTAGHPMTIPMTRKTIPDVHMPIHGLLRRVSRASSGVSLATNQWEDSDYTSTPSTHRLHLTSPHSDTHSVGCFASKDQLRKASERAKDMEVAHAQLGQTKAARSWWWR